MRSIVVRRKNFNGEELMNIDCWVKWASILSSVVVAISLVVTLYEVRKNFKENRKKVASKVFIWWDKKQTIGLKSSISIFQLSNHSNEPVHNVVIDIEYGENDTNNQNFPLIVGILPPGDFYILYDQHIETSMHKKVIPVVYFSDSLDRHWKRGYNGELNKVQFDIFQDTDRVPQPQPDLILYPI